MQLDNENPYIYFINSSFKEKVLTQKLVNKTDVLYRYLNTIKAMHPDESIILQIYDSTLTFKSIRSCQVQGK